jgi:hypothetical protein
MEGFQKFVLYSAIIILIIALVFIGITLSYAKDKHAWPPIVPACPDYWTVNGEGDASTCTNTKDLGTCPATSGQQHLVKNFNTAAFSGSNGACAKYTWANNCKVSWDGITYGVNNPCSKT